MPAPKYLSCVLRNLAKYESVGRNHDRSESVFNKYAPYPLMTSIPINILITST